MCKNRQFVWFYWVKFASTSKVTRKYYIKIQREAVNIQTKLIKSYQSMDRYWSDSVLIEPQN